MITPNKVVTLKKSALGAAGIIIEQGPDQIELIELYQIVSKHFESIDDFLLTIDLLYVLKRIDVDFATRMVLYAN